MNKWFWMFGPRWSYIILWKQWQFGSRGNPSCLFPALVLCNLNNKSILAFLWANFPQHQIPEVHRTHAGSQWVSLVILASLKQSWLMSQCQWEKWSNDHYSESVYFSFLWASKSTLLCIHASLSPSHLSCLVFSHSPVHVTPTLSIVH